MATPSEAVEKPNLPGLMENGYSALFEQGESSGREIKELRSRFEERDSRASGAIRGKTLWSLLSSPSAFCLPRILHLET